MTFKELQDDALDRLQYDNTQATSGPRTRMRRFINQWHRRILSDPNFSKLREAQFVFQTAPGQLQYGLPGGIGQVRRVYDAVTNNPSLILRQPDWLRYDSQANSSQGTPTVFVPYGLRPIFRKPPATGSGVWVSSDNALDISQLAQADTVRLGGYPHKAGPVPLVGISRVQLGTRTDLIDIARLSVSIVPQGDISIWDAAAGGNLLGVIPQGFTTGKYFMLQLYPVPSTVLTYTADVQLAISDMTLDGDEPMWDRDFHHLLSAGAVYEEMVTYKKQLDTAQLLLAGEIGPIKQALLNYTVNSDSYLIIPDDGRESTRAGSNLGSWFAAGRW